jgi:hypothetical protein
MPTAGEVDIAETCHDADWKNPLEHVHGWIVRCGRLCSQLHDQDGNGCAGGDGDPLGIAFPAEIPAQHRDDGNQRHHDIQQRRGQARVRFGQQGIGIPQFEIIRPVDEEELMQEFVRRLQGKVGILLHVFTQVERVLRELKNGELLVFVQLHADRVAQQQGRLVIDLHKGGTAGEDVRRVDRVSHVRNEDPA